MRRDIYQGITNLIVAELEKGARGSSRGTPSMPPGASRVRCAPTEFPTTASMMAWNE
jgi:antirestriction protein ArdC